MFVWGRSEEGLTNYEPKRSGARSVGRKRSACTLGLGLLRREVRQGNFTPKWKSVGAGGRLGQRFVGWAPEDGSAGGVGGASSPSGVGGGGGSG